MTLYPSPSGALGMLFPTKRKVFVSYHHGGDQAYYEAFSRTFHDSYEVVSDNSLERRFDSDDAAYVMRRIREAHISGTSCTIVLVGQHTWGRKYVDWEIDATLEKQHGLSVEIFELRAHWTGKGKPIEHPIAKATYSKSNRSWKIFWLRADLKWHRYEPLPEVDAIEDFLLIVEEDDHACFFG